MCWLDKNIMGENQGKPAREWCSGWEAVTKVFQWVENAKVKKKGANICSFHSHHIEAFVGITVRSPSVPILAEQRIGKKLQDPGKNRTLSLSKEETFLEAGVFYGKIPHIDL